MANSHSPQPESFSCAEPNCSADTLWADTLQFVRQSRRAQWHTARRCPSHFNFRRLEDSLTDAGHVTRVYFLGAASGVRHNALHYADLPSSDDLKSPPEVLSWQRLADGSDSQDQLSKEEQLLRERQRLCSVGVTNYQIVDGSGLCVYTATGSELMTVTDPGLHALMPPCPRELPSTLGGPKVDPQLSGDGALLSFVHAGDLWVQCLATGRETRISYFNTGSDNCPLSAGLPPFAVQEEFDRYSGSWWQPSAHDADTYRLLLEVVDESDVELFHIAAEDGSVDNYRYPRVGTNNAISDLALADLRLDSDGHVTCDVKRLGESLKSLLTWGEYLLRAGWTPSGRWVWFQVLDRSQRRTALVLLDPASFGTPGESEAQCGSFQIILEETSDVWIAPHDTTYFLTDDDSVEFLWCSTRTGFRHLYHMTSSSPRPHQGELENLGPRYTSSCARIVSLTSGHWGIEPRLTGVDRARGLVYITGSLDSVLERHVYVLRLNKPLKLQRLTPLGMTHTCWLSGEHLIACSSSLVSPPSCTVYLLRLAEDGVTARAMAYLLSPTDLPEGYEPPQHHEVTSASGDKFHTLVLPPTNLQPSQKYPTVLYVYGGPEVQLVTNSYKASKLNKQHALAQSGFCVLMADCRGSAGRGLEFEAHIRHKMGQIEISDQVQVLEALAERLGYIDLSRVAIHGWSYGGYLSLLGLAQRPDVFKVAIAGAPVTSWELYDTAYTERYMGTPEENPEAYRKGSVLEQVSSLPRDERRLLLVHGLADENVHFRHMSQLVTRLVKAARPHTLQVYPGERHGIRSPEASEHYETLVISFLKRNL